MHGAHVWADRFDGSVEDVFDLQDEVASKLAGVIAPALQAAEIERVINRPTADLDAYDLYLRALPLLRAWAREPVLTVIGLGVTPLLQKTRQAGAQRVEELDAPTEERQTTTLPLYHLNSNGIRLLRQTGSDQHPT